MSCATRVDNSVARRCGEKRLERRRRGKGGEYREHILFNVGRVAKRNAHTIVETSRTRKKWGKHKVVKHKKR